MKAILKQDQSGFVQLEIDSAALDRLIKQRHLRVEELHPRDSDTKQIVRKALLAGLSA